MKSILIVIILFTSLFADTIKYEKKSLFKNQSYYLENVEIDSISRGEVFYTFIIGISATNDPNILYAININKDLSKQPSRRLPASCDLIISIIDNDGNPIEFDCKENYLTPAISSSNHDGNGSTRLGGIFIMAGAGLLYSNSTQECRDCDLEELQSFSDDVTTKQKIGYLLIGIGGFFLVIGG